MVRIIAHILITAFALLLVAQFVPGIAIANLSAALVGALVLGLINVFVKPILTILTFPITILTLGLFTFILNAFLFAFAASFVNGFTVSGFLPALLGSFVVSVISSFFHSL